MTGNMTAGGAITFTARRTSLATSHQPLRRDVQQRRHGFRQYFGRDGAVVWRHHDD